MTKFLKKVFVCGVLLSSVSAYCDDTGIVTELYTKLEDGKLTLAESSLVVTETQETHTDVVIGALDDTLTLNPEKTKIQANAFPIATTNDKRVWKYFDDSSEVDIIPVGGGDNAIYKTYGASNQYICLNTDIEDSENKLYEKFSDGEWYVNTDSDDLTAETVAGATEVKVIDLNETDTSYSLATTGEKPDLLFNGVLATKDSGGVWTLSDGTTPLPRVKLEVNSGKTLTIGDKQVEEASNPSTMKNNASATLTFTEFGSLQGPGSVILLDDDYSTSGDPSTPQIQWATKAVFEPGSEAGKDNPVSISGGTTDLGQYLNKGDTVTGNNTDGEKLNLTIDGNVDVFSGIMPEALPTAASDTEKAAYAQDKSAAIDLFNESGIAEVFPNVKGNIKFELPHTYNVGETAYDRIDDLVGHLSQDNKFSLHAVSQDKIKGLFASADTTITYTMAGQTVTSGQDFVNSAIEVMHSVGSTPTTGGTPNVYWDVSSVSNMDSNFTPGSYSYNGTEGTLAVNVIPLDGDAYVIPYNNKHTSDTAPSTFDLKASTDKDPDAIQKYLEPDMTNVQIKDTNGNAFEAQPSITVSTELLGLGKDKTKTFFMNDANNALNDSKGPNLTITTVTVSSTEKGSNLKVKSKDGGSINRNELNIKDSNVVLYGNTTVQKLTMDSKSTLRIRGNFSWGTAEV